MQFSCKIVADFAAKLAAGGFVAPGKASKDKPAESQLSARFCAPATLFSAVFYYYTNQLLIAAVVAAKPDSGSVSAEVLSVYYDCVWLQQIEAQHSESAS